MSVVSNVVLLMSCGESDDAEDIPGLNTLNAWLAGQNQGALYRVEDHGHNRKAMECHVAIGAFNHLYVEEFLEAFRTAPWCEPDTVQLMFKGQDDHEFSMHRPTQRR